MKRYCAFGVDKSFKHRWQAWAAGLIYRIKMSMQRLRCNHNYCCLNIYIDGLGKKSAKHECSKCGKKRWVSI